MKIVFANVIGIALLVSTSPVSAYTITGPSGGSCTTNGATCDVHCNNGHLAGSMNWNGTVWTDGIKWDKDKDVEARKICDANGSDCV